MNRTSVITFVSAATLAASTIGGADTASIVADRDGTLIQPTTFPPTPETSSGAGDSVYVGRVGTMAGETFRRGALHFDLSSIPRGSTITSVSMSLYAVVGQAGDHPVALHRALADWGEGGSVSTGGGGVEPEAGDITWTMRFWPDVPWGSPGGDFTATSSASTMAPPSGACVIASTPALVADVQAWVDGTAPNFGWIMVGNEGVLQSVRRFFSHEWTVDAQRPTLTVEFTPPSSPGDLNGDGYVDGSDLAIVLGSWGPCEDCIADINDDGVVDGSDLAVILGQWDPA